MQPNEYQSLALKTEFTPDFVRLEGHTPEHNMMVARAIHACLGLASEVGEIADALKKHIIYKKALDEVNMLEEGGDVQWYVALLMTAVKRTMEESMEKNIAKLKLRFGDKFTTDAATVRDLPGERKLLEG